MITALIAALAAVIGGVIGSVFGPLVNERVERRKEERDHRRALIKEWRAGIAADLGSEIVTLGGGGEAYRDTVWYSSLEQYLSDEMLRKLLDTNRVTVIQRPTAGARFESVSDRLRAEVARIEREWGLG